MANLIDVTLAEIAAATASRLTSKQTLLIICDNDH